MYTVPWIASVIISQVFIVLFLALIQNLHYQVCNILYLHNMDADEWKFCILYVVSRLSREILSDYSFIMTIIFCINNYLTATFQISVQLLLIYHWWICIVLFREFWPFLQSFQTFKSHPFWFPIITFCSSIRKSSF